MHRRIIKNRLSLFIRSAVRLRAVKYFFIQPHNMAESWNKKEREKKKRAKKKEKEERRLERKENAKDSNPNDYFSYVDHDGNVTSTPPDPAQKKVFKAEDIEIGVPKQAEPEPEERIHKGVVTFFNESKGYGFIRDLKSQESIFVHINDLEEAVRENSKVEFEVQKGPKGFQATQVKVVR